MGFKFWEADAPAAYDGPITLTPDGGPFLYNDAVPYEMLLAAGVSIPSCTKGLSKARKKATKKD